MFRSPNLEVARAKRKSGWETYTQRAKTEALLRSRALRHQTQRMGVGNSS